MTTLELPQMPAPAQTGPPTVALAGQPNAGKTTLFNRLTGLRAKTANFPGTTVEARLGRMKLEESGDVRVLDLPGLYGLEGDSPDQVAADAAIKGIAPGIPRPDVLVVVLDATRLPHHLPLAGELRAQNIPVVVAVNMIDEAQRKRLAIDYDELGRELGAPVVPVSARRNTGIDALLSHVDGIIEGTLPDHGPVPESLAACGTCGGCQITARCRWADSVSERVSPQRSDAYHKWADRVDGLLTSIWTGLPAFAVVMAAMFIGVFIVAATPMDWIDRAFGYAGGLSTSIFGDGLLGSFVADGVIGGIGGVVIFLPQICILFFAIALLEDSGYLSRAVVMMDRLMRKVGLPGNAFVPMLSAHACAIPAIMSTRLIDTPRDRLRTILIIPLLTCSARLPVYAMVAALLFMGNPLLQGVVFFSGYVLGILAAVTVALVLRLTVLKGRPSPLAVELPPYRWPSLKVAGAITLDRGLIFLKQAGTIILVIALILWAAATFPVLPEDQLTQVAAGQHAAEVQQIETALAADPAPQVEQELQSRYDALYSRYALEHSAAGRIGQFVEPVFEPLGFDWRISIGVMTSFAAREVVVSSLAVISGIGEDGAEEEGTLLAAMRGMQRDDGSPLLDAPTSVSLLVFFVLAMQCLPTQAVTKRETGTWKWPIVQLAYMTALAYTASLIAYHATAALVA